MPRVYDFILGAIVVLIVLLVCGEMSDRDEHFEEMRQRELVTQTEKAVALISEGHK